MPTKITIPFEALAENCSSRLTEFDNGSVERCGISVMDCCEDNAEQCPIVAQHGEEIAQD